MFEEGLINQQSSRATDPAGYFYAIILIMLIKVIHIIVIFSNLILGFLVLNQNTKSKSNRIFSLMAVTAALWTFANYMDDASLHSLWLQTSYALGGLVISLGLVWTLSMTQTKVRRRGYILMLLISLFFCIGSYLPNFIIISFEKTSTETMPSGHPGWGLILYTTFYFAEALSIVWILHKAKISSKEGLERKKFKNVGYGALITLIVTLFNSFILPFFSIFPFGCVDNVGFLLFLLFITYSIAKHHLFDLKLVVVELIMFSMWTFLLVRIVLARNTHEVLLGSGMFIMALTLGIIFIQTISHNIKQREEITNLSKKLSDLYKLPQNNE